MAFWLFIVFAFQAPAVELRQYQCLDQTRFSLRLSEELAIVAFSDAEYRLPRRSSALAIKYANDKATLYLDGDFAAFVADDRPLPGCMRVGSSERR